MQKDQGSINFSNILTGKCLAKIKAKNGVFLDECSCSDININVNVKQEGANAPQENEFKLLEL